MGVTLPCLAMRSTSRIFIEGLSLWHHSVTNRLFPVAPEGLDKDQNLASPVFSASQAEHTAEIGHAQDGRKCASKPKGASVTSRSSATTLKKARKTATQMASQMATTFVVLFQTHGTLSHRGLATRRREEETV